MQINVIKLILIVIITIIINTERAGILHSVELQSLVKRNPINS